jgi:hypothetical protein
LAKRVCKLSSSSQELSSSLEVSYLVEDFDFTFFLFVGGLRLPKVLKNMI